MIPDNAPMREAKSIMPKHSYRFHRTFPEPNVPCCNWCLFKMVANHFCIMKYYAVCLHEFTAERKWSLSTVYFSGISLIHYRKENDTFNHSSILKWLGWMVYSDTEEEDYSLWPQKRAFRKRNWPTSYLHISMLQQSSNGQAPSVLFLRWNFSPLLDLLKSILQGSIYKNQMKQVASRQHEI